MKSLYLLASIPKHQLWMRNCLLFFSATYCYVCVLGCLHFEPTVYWSKAFNVFYGGVHAIFKLIWLDFIAVALALSTEFQHELSNKHTMLNGVRTRVYVCLPFTSRTHSTNVLLRRAVCVRVVVFRYFDTLTAFTHAESYYCEPQTVFLPQTKHWKWITATDFSKLHYRIFMDLQSAYLFLGLLPRALRARYSNRNFSCEGNL